MEQLHGYALTDKLRKMRRRYRFTATEQALYYELIAICNSDDWNPVFKCSNKELYLALNINESTLIRARKTLIDAKLLFYKSGKSVREVGSYSFVKMPIGGIKPANTYAEASDVTEQKSKNRYATNKNSDEISESDVPSVNEIEQYCIERKNNVSAMKFFDYYSKNEWKTGNDPIKDWRAVVRTCEQNDFEKNNRKSGRAALALETANNIIW